MQNSFKTKFEKLDSGLFEPLEETQLSKIIGADGPTSSSMPTYNPSTGTTQTDTTTAEDTPPPREV
ncbi:hypothetical protein GCM10007423_54550 [Dyadobacter endophyticus]|uniref:Serine endopeptidase inhibitors n=1 Tax=Dyadobacter endophyticus TaxID=1749036 RepID=A0ABQ1Z8E0_9BACT|nr:hypothetical protein [Dyadobacter endophyticus]GGH51272.1 hypothetical protein GCM10007423_54550 [Dyadobacter endophyticus]